MSEKEIAFNSNPFLQRAFYVEKPFVFIDHWVTDKYGFKAFKTENPVDRWVYFIIEENIVKATPEFLDDTELANLAFSRIKAR